MTAQRFLKLSKRPGQEKSKALYLVGENPVGTLPASMKIAEVLEQVSAGGGFVLCQDPFLTETGQLADAVFPASTYAEKEGTFTNTEGESSEGPAGARVSGRKQTRGLADLLGIIRRAWLSFGLRELGSDTQKIFQAHSQGILQRNRNLPRPGWIIISQTVLKTRFGSDSRVLTIFQSPRMRFILFCWSLFQYCTIPESSLRRRKASLRSMTNACFRLARRMPNGWV